MRKKLVMILMATCIALTGTACSTDSTKENTKEEKTEAAVEEETVEEPQDFGERLVSVDNVDKYVSLGEYKGISLNKTVEEVTEVEIDYYIEEDLKNYAEIVTDGTAELGDILTIDFVGLKDGTEFEGGTATDYDMVLGEAGFIEGFEDGIVGMKNGETKELNLTFPEDYFEESLAGQDVIFKVTVKSLRRAPELTDEWAAEKTDYATADEYRESMRAMLQEEAQENAEMSLQSTAWSAIQETSEIKEYPQEDIDNAIAEFKSETEIYAKQADMTIEEFLEQQMISMEDYELQCQQYAEYKVAQNLIVQAIMDAEGFKIGDEEWNKEEEKLISTMGFTSKEEILQVYGKAFLNESVGLSRVIAFVIENAEVTDMISENGTVGISIEDGQEIEELEEEELDAEEMVLDDAEVEIIEEVTE